MNIIYYKSNSTIHNSSYFKNDYKPISNLKYYIQMRNNLKINKDNPFSHNKNSNHSIMKTMNSRETFHTTNFESNVNQTKYSFCKVPKLSNEFLVSQLPNIIRLKKSAIKKKNDDEFSQNFKHFYKINYEKEKKNKINLKDFMLNKNYEYFDRKKKVFKTVDNDLKDIKNRTKLINSIANYIIPIVAKDKRKKIKRMKIKKEKEKEKNLNLINEHSKSQKNIKIISNNKNYIKIESLFRLKRNYSDKNYQNTGYY